MIAVTLPEEAKDFSFSPRVTTSCGAHRTIYPIDYGVLSLGVKRPGREAYHSSPFSTEVKKVDVYLHFPIHLHGIVLSKYLLSYYW
jgi:hypothetical protein